MSMIKREYKFCYAHRNLGIGGKCARIHGHIGRVSFTVMAKKNNSTGVTIEFKDIDAAIEPIIKSLDHFLLLDKKDDLCKVLKKAGEEYVALPFPTSAENIAQYLKDCATKAAKDKFSVIIVEFKETDSSTIIV